MWNGPEVRDALKCLLTLCVGPASTKAGFIGKTRKLYCYITSGYTFILQANSVNFCSFILHHAVQPRKAPCFIASFKILLNSQLKHGLREVILVI